MLSFRAGEMIQQMRGLLYEPDNLSSKVAGEDAHAHICPYLSTKFICLFCLLVYGSER